MQCCESHGKGVRKSAPKKAKYYAGVAVKNRISGHRQANCSYSEMYKTLKAEEIPISLSAIKSLKQQVMLRERKDLEGSKPHLAGMTTC